MMVAPDACKLHKIFRKSRVSKQEHAHEMERVRETLAAFCTALSSILPREQGKDTPCGNKCPNPLSPPLPRSLFSYQEGTLVLHQVISMKSVRLSLSACRSIRKWWTALPPNKKQFFREWAWQRRWRLTGAGTVLLLFISLFFITYMEESPVTGRTRLLVFSKEDFMKLTEHASEMVGFID